VAGSETNLRSHQTNLVPAHARQNGESFGEIEMPLKTKTNPDSRFCQIALWPKSYADLEVFQGEYSSKRGKRTFLLFNLYPLLLVGVV
jgi:hypothetical protein